MNPEQPGALRPDADVGELWAVVQELKKTVATLARVPKEPQALAVNSVHHRSAFIIMPFGIEELQVVYDDFVKPTIEQCGLRPVRGDDMFGSNVIMEDVRSAISASTVMIADLTGQNANVFYEVGIAHATDKPVLLLAQSLEDVPFDLRHRRILVYEYSPPGVKRLEQRLREHVIDIVSKLTNQE